MRCANYLLIITCGATLLVSGCADAPKRKTASKPAITAAKTPPIAPAAPAKPSAQQERYTKGLQLLKTSQWPAAETELLASAKDFPRDSGPPTNLGIVYARTNRKDLATAAFTKAVALNAGNAVAHNWLGVLAVEAGNYPRAEQAYRQALQADASYGKAHLNLGILYDQHLKRPQDALKEYRRYRDLGGKDDPKAAIWIAELEKSAPLAAPVTPAAAPSASAGGNNSSSMTPAASAPKPATPAATSPKPAATGPGKPVKLNDKSGT